MTENFNLEDFSQGQLADLAQLLSDQADLYDDDKLSLFRPHPGQLEFYNSNHQIRVLAAGNRFGKTTISVNEAKDLALGTHRSHPIPIPNKGKMYAQSYELIDQVFRTKFEEWLPKKCLSKKKPYQKNQLGQLTGLNFANGSIIRFGTYDQKSDKSESTNWDWVAFDEPPPRELYIANLRGIVDSGGRIWFTLTPLNEPWIFDDLWEPGMTGAKPYIKCISGSTYDNPTISKRGVELFAEEMTEEEKEVRIYGKFTKLRGLVIDTFDKAHSIIPPFDLDHSYVLYEGIDPHPGKPNAALWKAINKNNQRYVVAELSCDAGIQQFAHEVVAMRRKLTQGGAQLVKSVADTSLNQPDLMFKINQRDEFIRILNSYGERVLPQNAQKRDWVGPGIAKIRDLYRVVHQEDPHTQKIIQAPQQFVFSHCKHYLYELNHYQWPKHDKIGELKDSSKPIDRYNDFIDCDRYIESEAPEYITPGQSFVVHTAKNHNTNTSYEDRSRQRLFQKIFKGAPMPDEHRPTIIHTRSRIIPRHAISQQNKNSKYFFRGMR